MIALKKIFTVISLTIAATITAQDFQGVATYKSHRKVDFKMDDEKQNAELQEQIQAQLRKQFQQEYTLKFTKNESIYKKVEQLNKPNPMANSGMIITVSQGGANSLYKNIKEDRYVNKTDLYSKLFLIKDKLNAPKWVLGTETKNIGNYTCFKASYTEEIENMTLNDDDEPITEKVERTVTAWYTPQIPVNNGPQDFHGLPGLILEVNDGSLTLICSKIVMNPKETFDIKEPTKGKQVTQTEFDEIMEKKNKEMMERFHSRRGDGDHISIGIRN